MASTLTDYRYGGYAMELKKEIASVAAHESPLLAELTFDELTDNNVSRQRMYTDDGDITEHAVDGNWSIVNPNWDWRNAPLAILGDNVAPDDFGSLANGKSPEAIMADWITEKSKQISRSFDKLAVYAGTTAVGYLSGSAMVGITLHIARAEGTQATSLASDLDGRVYNTNESTANNTQVLAAAASASATLSLDMVQRLVDAVRPKATHIMCSRLARSKIISLAQASGTNLTVGTGKLGQMVQMYGDTILIVNDTIKDNFPDPSSSVTTISTYNYDTGTGDVSPIFAFYMGNMGFTGINGRGMIQIDDLGILESKNAKGKRVKIYVGTALRHNRAAAILCGATYT